MDFDFFSKVIDTIKKREYPQRIRFTGGEPMLHKELFDFIGYAKQQLPNSSVGMTTNGLLIRKNIAKILNSGLDVLTISLHAMNPAKYREITKVDGLNTIVEGAEMLYKEHFPGEIKINSVIDKKNIDEVEALKHFTEKYGFQLRIMGILKEESSNLGSHENDHINKKKIRKMVSQENIGAIKEDSSQPKCKNCEEKKRCGHEAAYLRITPGGMINPCLGKKEYDIPLQELGEGKLFQDGISLGLRRVQMLDK